MNRKQRRTAEKKRQKNDPEQLMADRIHLFGNLPNECNACQKSFDKKDKEMVTSWYVTVREEEGIVNLYCPECWERGLNLVQNFKEKLGERETKQE